MRATENQILHHTHRTLGGIPVDREPIFPQGDAYSGPGNLAALLTALSALPSLPLAQTSSDITAAVGIGTGGTGGSAFYQFIYAGAIALGQSAAQAQASAIAILTPFQSVFTDLSAQDQLIATQVNKILTALQTPVV